MDKRSVFSIPVSVSYVIKKLNDSGYEAYLVGGCVRDYILERNPSDWDVTTNALPEQIKTFLKKTYDTGIKHGTITVLVDKDCIEVTTFRIDGEYEDHRRPEGVVFTSKLQEDLERRDFTINALAYHPQQGILDYFDGISDIDHKIIRAVGVAEVRFTEDALRMMRAIRFSAQLGFDIHKDTFEAIKQKAHLIINISQERIREELNKILTSANSQQFNYLYESGLLKFIMPEFLPCYETFQNNPYHVYNVAEHSLRAVANIESNPILRWTMLLHDIGKQLTKTTDELGVDHFYGHPAASADIAMKILNRLRFDNKSIKDIVKLILYHDLDINPTEKSIRRVLNKVGEEYFRWLIKVKTADKLAQNPQLIEDGLRQIESIDKIYIDIKSQNQCTCKKDLAINGHDLISIGMNPGREMKAMLEYLLEIVLEQPNFNDRVKLIQLAESKLKGKK